MKAPKCYRCDGRHWSTQPCPNKERLTDAINAVAPAINRVADGGVVRVGVDVGEAPSRSQDKETGVRRGVESEPAPPTLSRTPNRRNREDYNAYMRNYMAAYRERSK